MTDSCSIRIGTSVGEARISMSNPSPTPVDRTKASIARVYEPPSTARTTSRSIGEALDQHSAIAPAGAESAAAIGHFLIRAVSFLAGRQESTSTSTAVRACRRPRIPTRSRSGSSPTRGWSTSTTIAGSSPTAGRCWRRTTAPGSPPVDLTDPDAVLSDPAVQRAPRLHPADRAAPARHPAPPRRRRPRPAEIMQRYIDALPVGLVRGVEPLPTTREDENSELARRMEEVLRAQPAGQWRLPHQVDEILAMLPGLELVPPGLLAGRWTGGPPAPGSSPHLVPSQRCLAGAVGRKP